MDSHIYRKRRCGVPGCICKNMKKILYIGEKRVNINAEDQYGEKAGFAEEEIKIILDNMHRNFNIKEIEVNGKLYRWPMILHGENCRTN